MGQVATTPTRLTPAQALGAFLLAGLPQSALLMVAAQSADETYGWGSINGKGFANWNAGNTTPSTSQLAAGVPWMTQGVRNMKYLAFPDPVSGARSMVQWVTSRGLLPYAEANDLAGYVGRLQAGCYLGCVGNVDPSTGSEITAQDYANYQSGIAGWMQRLAGVTPVDPPVIVPPTTLATAFLIGSATLAAGALAAYYVTHERLPLIGRSG